MKTLLKTLVMISLTAMASLALADPPGRVGRISHVEGQVTYRNTYNGEPVAAAVNWPVTTDNIISTAPGARAEFKIGTAAVRVDSNSEVEITQLDDAHFKLYLTQGSANVRIRNPELAQQFELETERGRVVMSEPSTIRVDAERVPNTTTLAVFAGGARFSGRDANLPVRAGRRMELIDGDVRMSDMRRDSYLDDFDVWTQSRDQRDERYENSVSARYVSPETTGYEELDRNGAWQVTPEYGAVWYPTTIAADWAPYRAGRWTWVEPWGWTWVDNAPWGYAPSHYGRWLQISNRWCWSPGAIVARPVWAPALVGWVGGRNWSVSFSIGSAPAIGWFPLAPREVYVPSYQVSPTYVQRINITHVTNITTINNVYNARNNPDSAPVNYQNRLVRNAVTVMPQDHFSTRKIVLVTGSPTVQAPQLHAAQVSAAVPPTIARAPATSPARSIGNASTARDERRHERVIEERRSPQAAPAQEVRQQRQEQRDERRQERVIEERRSPQAAPAQDLRQPRQEQQNERAIGREQQRNERAVERGNDPRNEQRPARSEPRQEIQVPVQRPPQEEVQTRGRERREEAPARVERVHPAQPQVVAPQPAAEPVVVRPVHPQEAPSAQQRREGRPAPKECDGKPCNERKPEGEGRGNRGERDR